MRYPAIYLAVSVAAIMFLPWHSHAQDGQIKESSVIRTIDSAKLDREYVELVNHREAMQTRKNEIDDGLSKMAKTIDEKKSEIRTISNQLGDPLSPDRKAELNEEIQQLQREISNIQGKAAMPQGMGYQQLATYGQKEKTRLLKRVRTVVAELAEEQGIDFVIENSTMNDRAQPVWFSRKGTDITDEVLKILNSDIEDFDESSDSKKN